MQKIPFAAEKLREWFAANKRDLPWRRTQDPYAIWVSEIMLQQTQVSVVIDYYQRWMERFPTIEALARAESAAVIKQWEGLGYYSRARHLHAAAQFLVAHHAGKLPSSKEELAKVKGLGPYTVGALLSFAFRQKCAAVDGNAIRVLTRYFALQEEVDQTETKNTLWKIAEAILPDTAPWEIVEGIIELGARVCKKEPQCSSCPLKGECRAFAWGIQNQLPKKGKKVEILKQTRNVFVICSQNRLLVKKTEGKKVMQDLYEFPSATATESSFPFSFPATQVAQLPQITHSFTRYRVTLFPTLWQAEEPVAVAGYEWVEEAMIREHPFSAGHRRILQNLKIGV